MENIFTYARVSTLDQNTDLQVRALTAAYIDATHRQEKKSGTKATNRDLLDFLLDMNGQAAGHPSPMTKKKRSGQKTRPG